MTKTVLAWDLAATENDGDWTAGVWMTRLDDSRLLVEPLRFRHEPHRRNERIRSECVRLCPDVVRIPRDPGAAGKESVRVLTACLSGFAVRAAAPTGSKVLRAEPFAAQVNAGNVVVRGAFVREYLEELRQFPLGRHDDFVDASAGTSLSQLVPPSGAPDWLLSGDSPAGWQVRHHTHAVNGDESDFRVKRGGQEFAHAVRPWRNFLWMGAAPSGGEGLDHFVSPLGDEHRVFVRDGEVRYQGSTYATPGAMDIESVVAEGTAPRVFEDQFRRVWVSFLSSGDVYTCFSDDHGRTWSEPTMLISNAKFPRHFPGFDGSVLWAAFRYVSGTSGPGHLIGRYQSAGDATPSSEFVLASASGALVVADDTFSVALGVDGAQQWSLFCRLDGDSGPSAFVSADFGRTWTSV